MMKRKFKEKPIIQHIYYIMIIFSFCLMLLCGYCTMDGTRNVELAATKPHRIEQVSAAEKNYYFRVDNDSEYNVDVVFLSHYQFIRVFADGREIYSQVDDGGIWCHANGSIWNFVTIPHGVNELRIQYVSAYEEVQDEEHEFYFGDKLEIYETILKDSLFPMLVSVLLVFTGLVMWIYGFVVNRKADIGKSLLYLGIFAFLLGLWSVNETQALTLLVNHRITSAFSAYLYLMMLCPAFILFSREFMEIEDKIIWKVLCNAAIVASVVCIVLQFMDVMDFKESVTAIHIMMVIDILYVVLSVIYKAYKNQITKKIRRNLTAFTVLLVAIIIDLIFYYIGTFDGDLFGRFVFLMFAIILGKAALTDTLQMIDEGKKAKFYEDLAITDVLTGLFNRNAYEMDLIEIEKKSDVLIVSADLNHLKNCNDLLGHAEGDHYIKTAAHMIRDIFSAYGKCYRIGGDEFLVLIEKGRKCPIEELMQMLADSEAQYNEGIETQFPVHIAVGYALYEGGGKNALQEACEQADEMMYRKKRQCKKNLEITHEKC